MFTLTYTTDALDLIDRHLDRREERLLRQKIEAFAAAPFATHGFAKRLQGSRVVRVRQGDWRALLAIDTGARAVTVFRVAHRSEVYD